MTTREFKTYRARSEGFDGDRIRLEGETFTTDIPKGSWMVELDADGNEIEEPDHTPGDDDDDIDIDADVDLVSAAAAENLKAALTAKDARIAELEAKQGGHSAELDKLTKALGEKDDELAKVRAELAKLTEGQADPGPLDKSIPDLTSYLETVSDVGTIDALIAAEKGGKSRNGALDALEARKTALQSS